VPGTVAEDGAEDLDELYVRCCSNQLINHRLCTPPRNDLLDVVACLQPGAVAEDSAEDLDELYLAVL
jgi:hypothetical protein